jgi:hypothetical protein
MILMPPPFPIPVWPIQQIPKPVIGESFGDAEQKVAATGLGPSPAHRGSATMFLEPSSQSTALATHAQVYFVAASETLHAVGLVFIPLFKPSQPHIHGPVPRIEVGIPLLHVGTGAISDGAAGAGQAPSTFSNAEQAAIVGLGPVPVQVHDQPPGVDINLLATSVP